LEEVTPLTKAFARLKLEDIYNYFEKEHPTFLTREEVICYIVSVLFTKGKAYGAELMSLMNESDNNCRISDSILRDALVFLESNVIVAYATEYKDSNSTDKRGRPRKVYRLVSSHSQEAIKLSELWHQYRRDINDTLY
jgi:DNA-binding PadR family transcriptional regulator